MQEKFYCVGCKSHYELRPTGLERKPSKGGSFRYAMKSVCPKGHRTSKICNEDDFADYADDLELCPKCGSESWLEEEDPDHAYHYDCSCSDCGHEEWKEVDGPDYDDYDDPRYEAEGMTVGVNLEALAPTADEPESGVALVPADSLMPEGSGRTIGSQSVSHNYTPFHAESDDMVKMFYISDYYDPETDELTKQKEGFSLISKNDFRMWVQETEVEPCVCGVSGCLSCYLDETGSWADGYGSNCTSLWFEEDFDAEEVSEYCDEYCEENGGHCASCCEHPSCEISDICVLYCDGDYHSGPCMVDGEEYEEDYDAEGILTKSEWDYYADRIKDHENELNELENQLSVSQQPNYVSWRSWIGLPDRMPSVITTSQDRKIVQKMESINTEITGLIKKMYPDGIKATYTDKDEYGDFVSKAGIKHYDESMDAEEFIAHRRLKDHLLSIMPDKVYGVKDLGDGDFEMRVADRYMDDVIEAVSEYQISESSDSFFLGQSKSTVAAVAAVAALGLAYFYNRR